MGKTPPSRQTHADPRGHASLHFRECRAAPAAEDFGGQGTKNRQIAKLSTEDLKQRAATPTVTDSPELNHILAAVERMDAAQLDTLLRFQLSTLGSVQFAEQVGLPLLHEVGRRWSNNEITIAAEHLLSNALRTLMGVRILQQPAFASWPTIVFATPQMSSMSSVCCLPHWWLNPLAAK